jgi:hypothetical protein
MPLAAAPRVEVFDCHPNQFDRGANTDISDDLSIDGSL